MLGDIVTERRILFLPDFGPRVGGGHAMRCLTLAQAVSTRGAKAALVTTTQARAALQAFWPQGVDWVEVQSLLPQGPAVAAQWRASVVVVDHYRIEARYESALAGGGAGVAALDDLADRAHTAGLVVDPSFGRRASDYVALAPSAKILTGPGYALLRPAFADARAKALARRGAPARRVLVALGLTDVGGITSRVTRLVLRNPDVEAVEAVVGAAAPSLAELRLLATEDTRLTLHVDAPDMAGLMSRADLAIGAGGSSTWERACLGLPSLTVILADNQAAQARALAQAGATLTGDAADPAFEAVLATHLARLLAEADLRARLSRASADLCDGRGSERVAAALLELAA